VDRPGKEYVPEEFAVAVAPTGPLRTTAAPLPEEAGLMVPERVKVGPVWAFEVKFTPVTSLVEMVATWVVGLKPNPEELGVTA